MTLEKLLEDLVGIKPGDRLRIMFTNGHEPVVFRTQLHFGGVVLIRRTPGGAEVRCTEWFSRDGFAIAMRLDLETIEVVHE